eukprot:1133438-Pelagomonas_calceolata.AAC.3
MAFPYFGAYRLNHGLHAHLLQDHQKERGNVMWPSALNAKLALAKMLHLCTPLNMPVQMQPHTLVRMRLLAYIKKSKKP